MPHARRHMHALAAALALGPLPRRRAPPSPRTVLPRLLLAALRRRLAALRARTRARGPRAVGRHLCDRDAVGERAVVVVVQPRAQHQLRELAQVDAAVAVQVKLRVQRHDLVCFEARRAQRVLQLAHRERARAVRVVHAKDGAHLRLLRRRERAWRDGGCLWRDPAAHRIELRRRGARVHEHEQFAEGGMAVAVAVECGEQRLGERVEEGGRRGRAAVAIVPARHV
mmetsp:Transcript_38653/g.106732  ORF Transcript_38653/g.106732 Transcript_38653/m.106732 type:complete len:226 (-) Transcript_38653:506-1183(-)